MRALNRHAEDVKGVKPPYPFRSRSGDLSCAEERGMLFILFRSELDVDVVRSLQILFYSITAMRMTSQQEGIEWMLYCCHEWTISRG